jgi:hypothetical protein
MRWRLNLRRTIYIALLLFSTAGFARAQPGPVVPTRLTTNVGDYQLLKLVGINSPFELSDSLKLGVAVNSGPSSSVSELRSFETSNPNIALGTVSAPSIDAWCVIGEQLFIGDEGKLEICQLPSLDRVQQVELTDAAAGARQKIVLRVPGGWYCDGYVFDDSGTKIVCAFYFRIDRPPEIEFQSILHNYVANLTPAPGSAKSLASVPAQLSAEIISNNQFAIVIRGQDGGLNPQGDRIPLNATGVSDSPPPFTHARVDERDCTFVFGDAGFLLRINSFDSMKADFLSPLHFRCIQPAMTLDGNHSPEKLRFLEPADHELPPAEVKIPPREILADSAKHFFEQRFGKGLPIETFKPKLEQYMNEVKSEFERTAGRQAKGIPVPVFITAQVTWPEVQPKSQLRYCVWGEWTRQALIELIFPGEFEQQRELERQRQEQARENEKRRRTAELQKQMKAQNRKRIQAGVSARLIWAGSMSLVAVVAAVLFRMFDRPPTNVTTLMLFGIGLLTACPNPQLVNAAETSDTADGEGAVMKLPFAPNHVQISPNGKWGVVRRHAHSPTANISDATFAIADLEQRKIVAERHFPEGPSQVLVSDDFLLAVFKSSRNVATLSLPDLKEIAFRQLDNVDAPVMLFAGQFAELGSRGRWMAPTLKDATGEWADDPVIASKWGGPARIYHYDDKFFVDGFLLSHDLDRVVGFCGHPRLFQPTVVHLNRGTTAPNATFGARRIAPFLKSIGALYHAGDQPWLYEIAVPLSFPHDDAAHSIETESEPREPKAWLRLQVVLRDQMSVMPSSESDRLLAKVRVEMPDISVRELSAIGKAPITSSGRRCLAVIQEHLAIFTLSQSCWDRLPRAPRLVDGCFPVVIDSGTTTTLEPKLVSGVPVEQITATFGPFKLSSHSGQLVLQPADILKQFLRESLFDSLVAVSRVSPRATLEDWTASFRDSNALAIQRIEALAGRKIQGIPLSVPLELRVTGKDQSVVESGRSLIIDLPPDFFRELFRQKQSKRLARLTPPVNYSHARYTISSPIHAPNEGEPRRELPEPTATKLDQPLLAHLADSLPNEKESFGPPAEIAINLLFSVVVGAALLSFSCRIYRRGLPPEESFRMPTWRQIIVTTIVVCLVLAACETLLVILGRKWILVDGWPSWLAAMVVCAIALFLRLIVAAVGVKTMLRLPMSEAAEIMLFLTLLTFVPSVFFLGGLFATTVLFWQPSII